jgi:hypothetical protein
LAMETARHEILDLERRSRRNRVRAWAFGITTGFLGGIGGWAAADSAHEPAAFFLTVGGLTGVGAVATARRSRSQGQLAATKRHRQRVQQVLALARAHQARLSVTLVASHLGLELREAEELLDSMVDGRRVDLQIDDQGRVSYVFPELLG